MKQKGIELHLPWPPTVNHYWGTRVVRNHAIRFLTQRAKDFRAEVEREVWRVCCANHRPIDVPVKFFALCYPPDRRVRDLSNLLKAVEDALTAARFWVDDFLVADQRQIRMPVRAGGLYILRVFPLADNYQELFS